MNREQIIREVANYLRPYDAKAADLALECVSSINSRMAEQQRSFDKVGSIPLKEDDIITEAELDKELMTYNLHPHSNKSLKVLTENDEGGHFSNEEIKRLIFLLKEYIK